MPEFTPINAEAISSGTSNATRSTSSSSNSQNGDSAQLNSTRRSRGAEHLVGSVVPADLPTHGVHDGRKVKLNYDFRVKPPRSQRTSEGRAANVAWCRENHTYLDADGFVRGLRADLFSRGQKLAFNLMIKARNDQSYDDAPSVPLTVSSAGEKLEWEASLNDTGASRDPIKFAAHLAKQTVRTKARLQAEEDWARQVQSKLEQRETRANSNHGAPLDIEDEESSSDDGGVVPASRPATESRYIAALRRPKTVKVSRGTKRRASSDSTDHATNQPPFKKPRTEPDASSVFKSQQSGTSMQLDSEVSSLTDCPSDLDLEETVSSVGPEAALKSDKTTRGTQQIKAEAGGLKSRTRLQGRIEYLLPRDEGLQRKIKAEGWPSFSSNGLVGSGKVEPEWRIVGERPVFSREGRFCRRGSGQIDQVSQLALHFQHVERPECELIYKLTEPDWENKENLLAWVKNVQQFLRRHLGPRKSSVPYADEEDAWLIEYAHDADLNWFDVTAGSKEAIALFKSFEKAFPQGAKRNKAGVLLKVQRLLGLK